MKKRTLILKPSVVNGLVPITFRYFLYAVVVSVVLFLVENILKNFNLIEISFKWWTVLIGLVILVLPSGSKLIKLRRTTYSFYTSHVESEFRFLTIKKHSVPYSQIVDMTLEISLWDRLTKAGNITLHTAEEKTPSLVLYYIRKPEQIEKIIYRMIYHHRKR